MTTTITAADLNLARRGCPDCGGTGTVRHGAGEHLTTAACHCQEDADVTHVDGTPCPEDCETCAYLEREDEVEEYMSLLGWDRDAAEDLADFLHTVC